MTLFQAMCPWAFTTNPEKSAMRLGQILGCGGNSSMDLRSCLRARNGVAIVKAQLELAVSLSALLIKQLNI